MGGNKAERALSRLLTNADITAAEQSLLTLVKILQNVVSEPEEPRYRQLKWSNNTVLKRVQERPGAIDLLRVAGFDEETGIGLKLLRDDPARSWLVLSCVQAALSTVKEMQRAQVHFIV